MATANGEGSKKLRIIKVQIPKKNFVKRRFSILLVISLILVYIAVQTTYLASKYIAKHFQSPPIVRDLIWEKLPYLPILWLSEILMILSIIYMVVWAVQHDLFSLPYAIILYSVFHLLRAGLIILTPLGFPYTYTGIFQTGKDSVFLYGAFPSGHLSLPYLTFMITKNKIALILTILVALTLLVSRGHYSIDLIGTLLLTYPLFKFSEKYLKKYFTQE